MSTSLITIPSAAALPVVPHAPIHIRPGTMDDIPFMDALQKKHSKQLGYFPTKQFEGYVGMGGVLIAEATAGEMRSDECGMRNEEGDGSPAPPFSIHHSAFSIPPRQRLGYIIYKDRYLKRDELGAVYQLAVSPDVRRGLVGAALVKGAFERSAYGCRLFCCWCAQDIEANHFWESLGFVPLAFRVGSTAKRKGGRIHIFWQRRVVESDAGAGATPWWYPFQTNQGAVREDRVVLPIPAGTHWSEVRPPDGMLTGRRQQQAADREAERTTKPVVVPRSPAPTPTAPAMNKVGILVGGKMKYVDRPAGAAVAGRPAMAGTGPTTPAPRPAKRAKPPAEKIDPQFLAAARELRDRYLEHVNRAGGPMLPGRMKYDVSRALPAPPSEDRGSTAAIPTLLPAA